MTNEEMMRLLARLTCEVCGEPATRFYRAAVPAPTDLNDPNPIERCDMGPINGRCAEHAPEEEL